MSDSRPLVDPVTRAALLREGIVVVEDDGDRVGATGVGLARVHEVVEAHLGSDVDVEVLGELPRVLRARKCVGHMEREEGRLQVRFVLRGDEHMDEIVVAETADVVVVLGIVCTSVTGELAATYEGPWHVYLDEPLGGREVIDGATGRAVPYKNVWAEIERERRPDGRVSPPGRAQRLRP